MPVWPAPDTQLTETVMSLHRDGFGADSKISCAVAPATWNVLGEHTDHIGGVVINATADLQVAVAASPRNDDLISVRVISKDALGKATETSGSASLGEVTKYANQVQHGSERGASDLKIGAPETRFAGVAWAMIARQYLSRDTKGFDITVLSDIPSGVGLGDEVAGEVAFAKILAELSDHKLDAPIRARLAELCSSAAKMFSSVPAFRSRYTAALRGEPEKFNIVDYADGSVTHTPLLRDSDDYGSFLVALPDGSTALTDISAREHFIDSAAAAFGVDTLRRLPDATQRVTQWLTAVHKAGEAEGLPEIDVAHCWLSFYESELGRATATAMALRARRATDALALINQSHQEQVTLYRATSEREQALGQLCLERGATAVRSASAGLANSIIVHAPTRKCPNLMADLADDGFVVVKLSGC